MLRPALTIILSISAAHTSMVWRRSLAAFAPLLFQTPETQ